MTVMVMTDDNGNDDRRTIVVFLDVHRGVDLGGGGVFCGCSVSEPSVSGLSLNFT